MVGSIDTIPASVGAAAGSVQHTVYLLGHEHPGWQRLRVALARLPQLTVLDAHPDAARALAQLTACQPDLIVLSASARDDTELVVRVAAACPLSKLVVAGETLTAAELRPLRGTSVHGYLLWADAHPARLGTFLEAVLAGWVPTSQSVADLLPSVPAPPPIDTTTRVRLRAFTTVLLAGLAEGLTRDEIARQAGISERTLARTLEQLQDDLGVRTPAAVVARAIRLGLL